MTDIKFLAAGDSAMIVEFGNEINPEINSRIMCLCDSVAQKAIKGVIECVPTFRSLMICYDCSKISYEKLKNKIEKRLGNLSSSVKISKKIIEIPVCYGGGFGEDLADVCAHTGLSEQEVINKHCSADYLIYMLGFLPGFAYLAGMESILNTPRLKNPRTVIPAGSVGIGGEQTGIYPLASPGGWRLIGRTPVLPYDPQREKPILYKAGDYIRFVPIDMSEYERIEALVKRREYECRTMEG